jgi:hypothetical protein
MNRPNQQRTFVALTTGALLLCGAALAVAAGAGGEPRLATSLAITTNRPAETPAPVPARVEKPATATRLDPTPKKLTEEPPTAVPQRSSAPRRTTETTVRRASPSKAKPARKTEDDDHETVRPEVRDEEDDGDSDD